MKLNVANSILKWLLNDEDEESIEIYRFGIE